MIKAVIFDCDGVLLRSYMWSYVGACSVWGPTNCPVPSFRQFCREVRQPFEEYLRSKGIGSHVTADQMWSWFLIGADEYILAGGLRRGTLSTLEILKRVGVPLAVVSACEEDLTRRKLEHVGILPYFELVKGGMSNKTSALLAVCEELSVDPCEVAFIGDLVSDVRDGNRAGLITVGLRSLCSTLHCLRLEGAYHVVPSHFVLAKWFQEVLACPQVV